MAKPHDGSQSFCSAVASVPFAHILLVKASHRAELHISGQRSVLSHVNHSNDNGQDYLVFLQGWGVDHWEQKDILPPAAPALLATFQVAELPPTPVTKQHNARNHA